MHIRLATESDVPAILTLIHALAVYEREPDAVQLGESELRRDGFGPRPLFECLIADDGGEAAGFALYFPISSTGRGPSLHLEDLFVQPAHRGRGIGKALMLELIAAARAQNYHVLVGGIDIANRTSVALHERLGFSYAGTVREAAYKFGGWLDLGFYQLILETPASPVDG